MTNIKNTVCVSVFHLSSQQVKADQHNSGGPGSCGDFDDPSFSERTEKNLKQLFCCSSFDE